MCIPNRMNGRPGGGGGGGRYAEKVWLPESTPPQAHAQERYPAAAGDQHYWFPPLVFLLFL